MSEVPKSFFIVLALVVFAAGLIVYFGSKQFLFRRQKRKGKEALRRGDYHAAVKAFRRAEALWDFNAIEETSAAYRRDLDQLEELITDMEAAAQAGGIALTVDEYREAIGAVRAYFQSKETGDFKATGKTYALAFMRLKRAQKMLREQLRAN